ncbi:hypothetical protein [Geodermatophilus sp. URMC 65]
MFEMFEDQSVELLPARTVMSTVSLGRRRRQQQQQWRLRGLRRHPQLRQQVIRPAGG